MYDFLIIGQGIAGTILSYYLEKRGYRICVIDNLDKKAPSQIASGIYNPISLNSAQFVLDMQRQRLQNHRE